MEDIIIEERATKAPQKMEPMVPQKPKKIVKKVSKKYGLGAYLTDWITKSLIVGSLIAINFLLFCRTGSMGVFDKGILWPEVSYILSGIAVMAVLSLFLLSFSRLLQNVFTALVGGLFVVVMLNQFALFDGNSFLLPLAQKYIGEKGTDFFAVASQWASGGITALILWMFLALATRYKIAFLGLLLAVSGSAIVAKQMWSETPTTDFRVVYEDEVFVPQQKGKKFVYIALPNLASYKYLQQLADQHPAAKTTLNAMLGFYARNKFVWYPNAYVNTTDVAENVAQNLNLTTDAKQANYLEAFPKDAKNWDFEEVNAPKIRLRKSELFENFRKSGYVLSVYENRTLELCWGEEGKLVNKCFRKRNIPAKLSDKQLSVRQKTMILAGEWLESMGIIPSMPRLYKFAAGVADVDVMPFIGASYKNLDVLDAPATLDVVAKDIAETNGNKAYFVNLNMPGEMYVYDEFCRVKPLAEWVLAQEKVYGKEQDVLKRRDAYLEQVSCLYGKLADFMRKIKENGDSSKTVVMIQGISGIQDASSLNFPNNWQNKQQVEMAVRDPLHKKFSVGKEICSTADLLRQYFYKNEKCINFNGLSINGEEKDQLAKLFSGNKFYKKDTESATEEFGAWYRNWLRANYPDMIIPIEMPKLKEAKVDKPKLQNPVQAKEVKTEEKAKKFSEAIKEEAVKEINYVNEPGKKSVAKSSVKTREEDTGTKVIIKIEAPVADSKPTPVAELKQNPVISEAK